ncbi:PREDICTED: uncharacterized protein LOC109189612 [Ipomoea nil]|uniref:uncharacterized protein LOC109189612 n=1 Tax=Ipomoea nil TaxID=35883 RepID=UPI000901D6CD|nr:PREDICTED: uncharacterized protein LOC109189612 [Ipomoea nil]XP_019195779.1 PREDICTED: uncharacterized protein LOC109189612 [Ipomoea nil]XP_019195785.1 PREDICTED: uncharacterized protein LOC109189612 [Ipomoea nil]
MSLSIVPSCLGLRMSQLLVNSGCLQQEMRLWNCGRYMMKVAQVVRPRIIPCIKANANGLQVFVLSDLHTDYSENMTWVRGLSRTVGQNKDVLLVAGDVAETRNNFVLTMSLLKDRFAHVFFVPGNHDLWLRREKDNNVNSLEKLDELLDACQRIGVETNPTVVDGLGIIPLFSWYHESFDREMDITSIRIPSLELACKDYNACRWPAGLINGDTSLALYFDGMNDKNQEKVREMQGRCHQIISFSHFVPRQELCPEKRMLFYPNLPKIAGSEFLEARIRHIHGAEGSDFACHVFGHTHFCWDAVLDGIRYVQAPLAYPRERKRRMNGGEEWVPYCIYSGGEFSEQVLPCYWSDYYALNPRNPKITQLAPWVATFYRRSS